MLVRDLFTGERVLLDAAMVSTVRIVISFLLAAAVALPLGVLMGAYEPINRTVEPLMAPLRYMPISAFIPLTILWFGIGERQKIAFLFLWRLCLPAARRGPAPFAPCRKSWCRPRTLGASRTQVIPVGAAAVGAAEIFDSFRVMNAIAWTYDLG